jgi:hypothetical protein
MIRLLAKVEPWQQVLAAGVILLLWAHVCCSVIVAPQWQRLRGTRARVAAERNLIAATRSADAERQKLQAVLDSLLQQARAIDSRCVAPDQALKFFAGLGTVAAATQCRLDSVELYPEQDPPPPLPTQNASGKPAPASPGVQHPQAGGGPGHGRRLQKQQARVTAVGTFPCVIEFLTALSNGSTPVHVSNLRLDLVPGRGSKLNLGFTVTLFILRDNTGTES